jgi:hypothetical protein
MRITASNRTTISGAPREFLSDLRNRLTLVNPRWGENECMGRWNGNTPEQTTENLTKNDERRTKGGGKSNRFSDQS